MGKGTDKILPYIQLAFMISCKTQFHFSISSGKGDFEWQSKVAVEKLQSLPQSSTIYDEEWCPACLYQVTGCSANGDHVTLSLLPRQDQDQDKWSPSQYEQY